MTALHQHCGAVRPLSSAHPNGVPGEADSATDQASSVQAIVETGSLAIQLDRLVAGLIVIDHLVKNTCVE